MKPVPLSLVALGLCVAMLSPGCATRGKWGAKETVPILRVAPNPSGIEITTNQSHGPKGLLEALGALNVSPDIPSGVTAELGRVRPLHNAKLQYLNPEPSRLEVVSIERPADYIHLENEIREWKVLLGGSVATDQMRKILYHDQLTEIPWVNAGRCFHAKLRRRTFPWGNAILFLTTYAQDSSAGPVNNYDLVLTMQGITTDNRYAVKGRFEIRHPKLPGSMWDTPTKGMAVFSRDREKGKAER